MPVADSHETLEGVHTGSDPGVLHNISLRGAELAVWRRAPATQWGAWLDELPTHALPACRLVLKPSGSFAALHAACDACGTPSGPARDALIADMADLAARFAASLRAQTVRLRLDVVTHNACRRWHRDCVPLRLICTYRGPGTRWVPPAFGRVALAHSDEDEVPCARDLQAGEVALFKGCGWPGHSHDGGIVHRSPRIEGTGLVRLVLVCDLPHGHL
jgi:hypothetical protein